MENNPQEKLSDLPVSDLLARIKNGAISPRALDKSTRQLCVEVLIGEGYSHVSIASLFKINDRTVRRDFVEIRQRNAVSASPELTKQLVGELIAAARNHYASQKQIARTKDAFPDERSRAEAMAWKGAKELLEKLFLIGYITTTDGLALNKSNVIKDSTANLSQEDADIRKRINDLPPIEKEKLREKLHKDILDIAARKAEQAIDADIKPEKEEIPPPELVS